MERSGANHARTAAGTTYAVPAAIPCTAAMVTSNATAAAAIRYERGVAAKATGDRHSSATTTDTNATACQAMSLDCERAFSMTTAATAASATSDCRRTAVQRAFGTAMSGTSGARGMGCR